MNSPRKWNDILRHQRELRGWTQQQVAKALHTDEKRVSSWERGVSKPSPHYRARLCKLYGKNAEELGFVEQPETLEPSITQNIAPTSPIRYQQQDIQKSSAPDPDWLMPLPPQPYFAHPYPLQKNFTGRVHERQRLTEWLTEDKRPVLALVALGGMGKSSLAWAWLQQDILSLPEATRPHGVLWWSFYEPEATFALFLDQALIYVSSGTVNPRGMTSLYEKTQALLALLQRHCMLLVLDGFERALRAYANLNAAYQGNDAPQDTQGNFRVCIDPHLGSFLRWLAADPLSSKVLLTTRLLPRELDGLAGCRCEELMALKTEDAMAFFRAQGVQGTRAETEALCTLYGNHPLALWLLTGLIVNDPARPTDVAVAIDYHPLTELIQREHHILSLAYDALHPLLQQVLSQLAAFRSKVNYEMIKVVSPFEAEKELKAGLRELVERGLLFFDREQRSYDLHPVLRQYAYARLLRKEEVHARIADYFWSLAGKGLTVAVTETPRKIRAFSREPSSSSRSHLEHLEDLGPIIELCHHLIRAKQFEQAFGVYYHHLAGLLYHHLGAYQIVIELLQAFFPDDGSPLPVLERNRHSWLLDAHAHAYSASGYPQRAVGLLRASIRIDQECDEKESLATSLWNLGVQLQVLGRLSESEQSLQECITLCRSMHDSFNKAKAHQYFALLRAYQGLFKESSQHISTALSLFKELGAIAQEGAAWAYQALCLLLAGEIHAAFMAAQRAHELADVERYERDIIRAEWLLGAVLVRSAMPENERTSEILREAELHLSEALQRCRRIDMVDYEADLLLAWARLHHAQGARQQAKADVTEALVIANRSDFRTLRADISNLLARLELEDGDHIAASNDARAALNDALCDGPPYCYKPALEEAKHLLKTLNQLPQSTHVE
jgi:tetratricopeptide (TPR) repeat protein/transcriptional regulator with XRE-family HTH domain